MEEKTEIQRVSFEKMASRNAFRQRRRRAMEDLPKS